MTQNPGLRTSATFVAVVLSVMALSVAAMSTAFAAGLAAHSVGAKQLRNDAVRSAKIKNEAVTTAKIKAGAVTADRMASGVLPAKTVHVARTLALSGTATPLLTVGGLSFDATCDSDVQDYIRVLITRVGGGLVTASGIFALETTTIDGAYPSVETANTVDVVTIAPSDGGFGALSFNGIVTPAGSAPVQVQVTVQVDDGAPTPCQTFVTAMPIG
jgi:hypothetical protein